MQLGSCKEVPRGDEKEGWTFAYFAKKGVDSVRLQRGLCTKANLQVMSSSCTRGIKRASCAKCHVIRCRECQWVLRADGDWLMRWMAGRVPYRRVGLAEPTMSEAHRPGAGGWRWRVGGERLWTMRRWRRRRRTKTTQLAVSEYHGRKRCETVV